MEVIECLSSSSSHVGARRTASTRTPETIHGSHLFHINGYRAAKCQFDGMFITSGKFNVGGYEWVIHYYPNGHVTAKEGYVSLFLHLKSFCKEEVRAFFELRLVNPSTGLPSSELSGTKRPRVFKADKCGWGFANFKTKIELEFSVYTRNDRLTIEASIDVVKKLQVSETTASSESDVPPSNMSEQFGKQLQDMDLADVTFRVGGEAFTAHKMVLALRSPVFKGELYGQMKEEDMLCITIDDMEPAVFKALLHFIYTDSLPSMDELDEDDTTEMIRQLLVAADRYAMDRLKLICGSHLCKSLHVETAATTLALAYQNHCDKLKDACVKFILTPENKGSIVASLGYQHLKRNGPSLILDMLDKMIGVRKF